MRANCGYFENILLCKYKNKQNCFLLSCFVESKLLNHRLNYNYIVLYGFFSAQKKTYRKRQVRQLTNIKGLPLPTSLCKEILVLTSYLFIVNWRLHVEVNYKIMAENFVLRLLYQCGAPRWESSPQASTLPIIQIVV